MDAFYIGDCLRALNLNPTLAVIEKVGGKDKKKEKMIKVDDFLPIFAQVKKDKDAGSYEDFMEVLKLYDKAENGMMMYAELEHILLSLGEWREGVNWQSDKFWLSKYIPRKLQSEIDNDGISLNLWVTGGWVLLHMAIKKVSGCIMFQQSNDNIGNDKWIKVEKKHVFQR